MFYSDSVGGGTTVGDIRWVGAYGVEADLIARSHCAVEFIHTEVIQVPQCILTTTFRDAKQHPTAVNRDADLYSFQ